MKIAKKDYGMEVSREFTSKVIIKRNAKVNITKHISVNTYSTNEVLTRSAMLEHKKMAVIDLDGNRIVEEKIR